MAFIAVFVLLTLYFLPTIVALVRSAPDTGSVIVLNLCLGWTFLGWVISMAMAARSNTTSAINVNVSQQAGDGYPGVAYSLRPQQFPSPPPWQPLPQGQGGGQVHHPGQPQQAPRSA